MIGCSNESTVWPYADSAGEGGGTWLATGFAATSGIVVTNGDVFVVSGPAIVHTSAHPPSEADTMNGYDVLDQTGEVSLIAGDTDNLYVAALEKPTGEPGSQSGFIYRRSIASGATGSMPTLASADNPIALAIDASNVYWIEGARQRDEGVVHLHVERDSYTGMRILQRGPKSSLNQRISRSRRFATQRIDAARVKRIATAATGTVNDVVLAITGSALRRFLIEQGTLPDAALVAMIPVNIRPKDDPGGGNAVGAMLATLASDVSSPKERLKRIIESTQRAKAMLQGMSKIAIMQYSALVLAPMVLSFVPGVAGRVRPAFNVVVSNVPGPESPLYFRGWTLDEIYPLSIPFHGYGLNKHFVGHLFFAIFTRVRPPRRRPSVARCDEHLYASTAASTQSQHAFGRTNFSAVFSLPQQ